MISSAAMRAGSCTDAMLPRRIPVLLCAATLIAATACTRSTESEVDPVTTLYNQGRYAETLPLLRAAVESGPADGRTRYRLGFCLLAVEGDGVGLMEQWNEAEKLLEGEIAEPEGATLERLYFLAKINTDQLEDDRRIGFARRAVKEYEFGPNPNALDGEDWFRLGRMHEFLGESSEAEASYRRALSKLTGDPAVNPVYLSLANVWIASLDFGEGRYREAAEGYDRAAALTPGQSWIDPYAFALALLASGRFDESIDRFGEVRQAVIGGAADNPQSGGGNDRLIVEAQYGADLARKAREVRPVEETDRDGVRIGRLSDDALTERVLEAAKGLRDAREKYSLRPGESLPQEVAEYQRWFVALVREKMVRDRQIQDFCLRQGIADLIRR